MSKRSAKVYLQDILESIDAIDKYLGDSTEYELSKNIMQLDAIVRRFIIIGEASSQMSLHFKEKYPNIDWRYMKAMRNKVTHEYFGLSVPSIYSTIKTDLPVLKDQVIELLKTI